MRAHARRRELWDGTRSAYNEIPRQCQPQPSRPIYARQLDRVSLFLGGTTIGDLTQPGAPSAVGAFAAGRIVRVASILRIDASGSYSRATYVDMLGAAAGPGLTLFGDALDLSVYYRATTLQYRSISTSLIQHAAGGTVILVPDSAILVAVQGEAIAGDDTKALMLFGTATWHPRL